MTSNKPYFIRALYEWILDNSCTPYIVVDATLPFVEVPEQFITEGKIILNILPSATHNLYLGDDWITFSARFSGVSQEINVPIGAVAAIYAQENGEGMGFETEALPADFFDETTITIPSKTTQHKPRFNLIETDIDSEKNVAKPSNQEKLNKATLKPEKKSTIATKKEKGSKKPTLTIIK